ASLGDGPGGALRGWVVPAAACGREAVDPAGRKRRPEPGPTFGSGRPDVEMVWRLAISGIVVTPSCAPTAGSPTPVESRLVAHTTAEWAKPRRVRDRSRRLATFIPGVPGRTPGRRRDSAHGLPHAPDVYAALRDAL